MKPTGNLEHSDLRSVPSPFGAADSSPAYFARPTDERLSCLPEALMKLAEDGYRWEREYSANKPEDALTILDYPNIYSFIHSHNIAPEEVRRVLSDASLMVHHQAFSDEEINLLLSKDEEAVTKHFASSRTIVIGNKGYSEKWMYEHSLSDWQAAGITPEMVARAQPHYYDPLFSEEAADFFTIKLQQYTSLLTPVKWKQRQNGKVRTDGHGVKLEVREYCQHPDSPTGCECVALYILLDYYGIEVTVDQLYDLLPRGPKPYERNGVRYGANPEREFVGDPRNIHSYGVFNEPIRKVAEHFISNVQTEKDATIEDIRRILDTGNPVLVWFVTCPMRKIMYRWSWLDENGERVDWPGGEHAVVVCGYDDDSLYYSDPNSGRIIAIDYETFNRSFKELGGRIVYRT